MEETSKSVHCGWRRTAVGQSSRSLVLCFRRTRSFQLRYFLLAELDESGQFAIDRYEALLEDIGGMGAAARF